MISLGEKGAPSKHSSKIPASKELGVFLTLIFWHTVLLITVGMKSEYFMIFAFKSHRVSFNQRFPFTKVHVLNVGSWNFICLDLHISRLNIGYCTPK